MGNVLHWLFSYFGVHPPHLCQCNVVATAASGAKSAREARREAKKLDIKAVEVRHSLRNQWNLEISWDISYISWDVGSVFTFHGGNICLKKTDSLGLDWNYTDFNINVHHEQLENDLK
jgi:hypothetical protein